MSDHKENPGLPIFLFGHSMGSLLAHENEAQVPRNLPILVISGEQDPAGGATQAVLPLIQRYQALGIHDVSYKFYTGARHEILNELNRDEVQADLLAWLDGHLKA